MENILKQYSTKSWQSPIQAYCFTLSTNIARGNSVLSINLQLPAYASIYKFLRLCKFYWCYSIKRILGELSEITTSMRMYKMIILSLFYSGEYVCYNHLIL